MLGLLLLALAAAASALAVPVLLIAGARGERRLGGIYAAFATLCLSITTSAPALFVGVLYAASWRLQEVTGSWPLSSGGPELWSNDPAYLRLIAAADPAFGALFLWTPGWFCLMALLRNTHPRWARGLFIALFCAGWLLLCIDPGRRVAWWID